MHGTSGEAASNAFGFAHLWAAGDLASHGVVFLLTLMSVASWYFIFIKLWQGRQIRRAARASGAFWSAASLAEGLERLRAAGGNNPRGGTGRHGRRSPFVCLLEAACRQPVRADDDAAVTAPLQARFAPSEQMERALRQQLAVTQLGLEQGLTLLATIGATAPFVGLFGTVWGIYHALVAIGISGQTALEQVAGPVGEALIMTAAGLLVALPAVFAFNAFGRANRVFLAELDAFADDLLAFFAHEATASAAPARALPRMAEGA
ncbi:MotA/TolQ/ExbB proton channel family protein [Rhodocyclus tenuis]|uniref:MotA/TolQ/ExbB proton channel family protein n=1 Tax=Rhodocyclus gracilis TaxID=2929842 RepID=UPI001298D979|nr:MotA/TolQ/ExbB proton channel family protein [Rhodocyclus gracilis]MRD73665.1 MotA/TolQ/ExbB proton channel family protein [Rhodocyclus gracilis]